MNKKERIIALSSILSEADIAAEVEASLRYVRDVLKTSCNSFAPQLTLQNYIDAKRRGFSKKKDLCTYFGVSRMTLHRFENNPDTVKKLNAYNNLISRGKYEIVQQLTDAYEILITCNPKDKLTRNFKAAIDSLKSDI